MRKSKVSQEGAAARRPRTGGALWLLLALLASGTLACGPGGECDTCKGDGDCESGLTCATFGDAGYHMCAKPSTKTCSAPY